LLRNIVSSDEGDFDETSVVPLKGSTVSAETETTTASVAQPFDVVLFQGSSSDHAMLRRQLSFRTVFTQLITLAELAGCVVYIVRGELRALFVVGAILTCQQGIFQLRARRLVGATVDDVDMQARITPILKELCVRANCELPRVSLKRTFVVVAMVPRSGYATLLISPDFIQRVDDDVLRAVLAHEVAHITHGDLAAVTRRAKLAVLVPYVVGLIGVWTIGHNSWVALFALIVLVIPFGRLILLLSTRGNRQRESHADVTGAIAVDNREAMIRGLQEVYLLSQINRDRVYPHAVWRWALFPFSMRAKTHPSLEKRISELKLLSSAEYASD
jgi:Zn-dependent protease with chaperone function